MHFPHPTLRGVAAIALSVSVAVGFTATTTAAAHADSITPHNASIVQPIGPVVQTDTGSAVTIALAAPDSSTSVDPDATEEKTCTVKKISSYPQERANGTVIGTNTLYKKCSSYSFKFTFAKPYYDGDTYYHVHVKIKNTDTGASDVDDGYYNKYAQTAFVKSKDQCNMKSSGWVQMGKEKVGLTDPNNCID